MLCNNVHVVIASFDYFVIRFIRITIKGIGFLCAHKIYEAHYFVINFERDWHHYLLTVVGKGEERVEVTHPLLFRSVTTVRGMNVRMPLKG